MSNSDSSWFDDVTIDNVDWRDVSPLSNAFVDTLLLALIRAHPMQSGKAVNELERLRDAKKALFGIKPKDDLKTIRDFPLLAEMAREYIADRGGATYQMDDNKVVWGDHIASNCRGVKTLARDVIHEREELGEEFSAMVEEDSVINRLARKFRAQCDDLVKQVAIYDGVETGHDLGWLQQARSLFGPFMIPVAEPVEPVRDMKHLF